MSAIAALPSRAVNWEYVLYHWATPAFGSGGRTRTGDHVVMNDNPILRPVEKSFADVGWTRDGFDVSGRESNPHLVIFTRRSNAVELPSSIIKSTAAHPKCLRTAKTTDKPEDERLAQLLGRFFPVIVIPQLTASGIGVADKAPTKLQAASGLLSPPSKLL
jgi:hypothetical protein